MAPAARDQDRRRWWCSGPRRPTAPASVTELALWVGGRSREALAEAAIADRLVTELPENADRRDRGPVERVGRTRDRRRDRCPRSFDVTLNSEPRLGRAFLVYEVDKKAHWTGVARSINGHVVRGGYRADAKGLGGVQVEEINPAWLQERRQQHHVRADADRGRARVQHQERSHRQRPARRRPGACAPGAGTPLSDGDLATGVGGPGAHTASLSVSRGS